MSWRDSLVRASYQGAEFWTTGREHTHGHRLARHDYAGRDGSHFEPLSQGARRWTLDAFLLGGNCLAARDALLGTLANNPVGTYVDPFGGAQRYVAVTGEWSVCEGQSEGLGFCRVSITFEENLQDPYAPPPMEAVAASKTSANRYLAWADGVSKSGYVDAINAAQERVEGVAATVSQLSDEVTQLWATIYGPIAGTLTAAQEAAAALNDLEDSLQALASAPDDLYDQAALVFATIGNLDVL